MYRLHEILVEGFRGSPKPIVISMNNHVNFVIGRNGTGKTTLINLVNSALSANVTYLMQADFKSIALVLKGSADKTMPSIRVYRAVDSEGTPEIRYEIRPTSRAKKEIYTITLDEISGPWRRRYASQVRATYAYREEIYDPAATVRERLATIVRTSWISVHRAAMANPTEGEERFESPVDRKMHQVSRGFGTFFSTLDKQAAEETDKFQQIYLLSLISPPTFESLSSIGSVDTEDEKKSIRGMFAEFKIRQSAFTTKLDSFMKRMSKALEDYGPDKPLRANDLLVLTDTVRIHDVIKEWHRLLEKRADIYRPKTDFVNILNELLYKKTVQINAGNEPVF